MIIKNNISRKRHTSSYRIIILCWDMLVKGIACNFIHLHFY